MKRAAPRRLKDALEAVAVDAAPAGVLARVQRLWPEVAGGAVAAESEPASEREGVLTVRCTSSLWAHELDLMAPDIRARLNAKLGSEGQVRGLRFVVSAARPGPPRAGHS